MNGTRRSVALEVRDLTVTLPFDGHGLPVVDHVGLELAPGEITGLIGESGSGKTLAASALLGMVPPSGRMQAAALRLGDLDLRTLDERGWRRVRGSRIAMIFQDPLSALDPVFTIGYQFAAVMRRHRGLPRREAEGRACTLLAGAGLADPAGVLRRYPHELSGGMRQRVLMALALSCEPEVLIADEPTTALDATTQAQVLELLRQSATDAKIAVLLVTHDLLAAQRTCDRALVMYAGRIVEEGAAADVLQRPAHPYTAGLLAAMPRVSRGTPAEVRPLRGQMPAPGRLPAGCVFSDRCERAQARCRAQPPALLPGLPWYARRQACHYPLGEPNA